MYSYANTYNIWKGFFLKKGENGNSQEAADGVNSNRDRSSVQLQR